MIARKRCPQHQPSRGMIRKCECGKHLVLVGMLEARDPEEDRREEQEIEDSAG